MAFKIKDLVIYSLLAFFVLTTTVFLVLFAQAADSNSDLASELARANLQLQETQDGLDAAESAIVSRNREISLKNEEIGNLTTDIAAKNSEILSLKSRLDRTEAELEETRDTLENAETEIADIRDEALAMETSINQSIQWFSENSILPSRLKTDRFVSKAEKGCVDHDKVNLACISYLMSEELGFTYKSDPTGDRLYSIEEILSRKGGDCEDYALFFKATLNYLDASGKDLEAWQDGTDRYLVYEDWSTYTRWYYDDAEAISLGEAGKMEPYAVCFYYDTEGAVWEGHCIMMLVSAEIDSPADITNENLADAVFFEPQNGKYLGKMGEILLACQDGEGGCADVPYHINFVITDNDLFHFSGAGWSHYEGYLERTDGLIAKLDQVETT